MVMPRPLVIACEVLAGLAVVLQFILPRNFDIAFRVSPSLHVGLPMRSLVPTVLIALAGIVSIVARRRDAAEKREGR